MIMWFMELFSMVPESLHRLGTYITFRALMAVLTSFFIGLFFGKKLINIIYQLNFRDNPRAYGDISSRDKSGTPTMGGLIIFLSFLISVVLWGDMENFFLRVLLFASFWFTALGFLDDYLKRVRGSSDAGLGRGMKLFFRLFSG